MSIDTTNYKRKVVGDINPIREAYYKDMYGKSGIRGTNVIVADGATGLPLIQGRKSNKVLAAGSLFTASNHFAIPAPVSLPSMNTLLGLDNSEADGTEPTNIQKVVLFGVAIDGALPESTEIKPVDYKGITKVEDMVPFRYPANNADLNASQRQIYFGKKTGTVYSPYYFKAFDIDPVIYMQYSDGTPVDSSLYISTNNLEVECFAELRLKITKEDCREFFAATATPAEARINSIMLFDAWYTEIEGIKYFQNIQPLTKLNIVTESLQDPSKGIDIVYHIYY